MAAHPYSFQDDGELIEVSCKIDCTAGSIDVHSTTTTLSAKLKIGPSIFNIPELFSTVDASKTTYEVREGELSITLHKLAPDEKWTSLNAVEGAKGAILKLLQGRPPPRKAPEGDTEGAMEARELVKQLFEAALGGDTQQLQAIAPRVSPEGLSSVKDGNGRNALHFAAQGGQAGMAEHLLDNEGIPVNSQDEQGETPLGLAAGGGQVEVAKLLLRHGADVHLAGPSKPQPLHRGAATGNTAAVEVLLDAGANLEAPSDTGTPLLWAAGSGSQEVVTQLLAAGADPNARSPDGVTAMLMAAASGNVDVIEGLGRRGADANVAAEGGVTPLHAAAEMGNLTIVQALLKARADPNALDSGGCKPIHAAASAGHADIVQTLLPLTQPGEGETWTLESLMAETSSGASATSPSQPQGFQPPEAEDPDPEKATQCKRQGDKAFSDKEFTGAERLYTNALRHDTSNHLLWANRSAARLRQGKNKEALQDARTSRQINPKYLKAWYREGEAARLLELYEEAAQAFYEAYSLDPTNSMVAKDFQDAVARGREQHAARQAGNS